MVKKLLVLICLFGVLAKNFAADSILIEDHYADLTKIFDNSKLVYWGDSGLALKKVSCFEKVNKTDGNGISYDAIALKLAASPYSTYNNTVSGKPSLRTHSCFDYPLNRTIQRNNCSIKIEFDVLWSKLDNTLYGEYGRVVVFLINEYPAGGAQFGDADSMAKPAPFGRPMYNMRIRNPQIPGNQSDPNYSPTFLLYGGGHDIEGEFEDAGSPVYHTAGFSSEAGGGSPGQPSNYDYPDSVATKKSLVKPWQWVATTNTWKHITWVIEPEIMKLYQRSSNQPEINDVLINKMAIPKDSFGTSYILNKLNNEHGTTETVLPLYYKWFPEFNGFRVYFRAWQDNICYFANFKATKITPEATGIKELPVIRHFAIYPNPSGDAGVTIEINNPPYGLTKCIIHSVTGQTITSITFEGSSIYLPTHNISPGVYFITVSSGGWYESQKLIIR